MENACNDDADNVDVVTYSTNELETKPGERICRGSLIRQVYIVHTATPSLCFTRLTRRHNCIIVDTQTSIPLRNIYLFSDEYTIDPISKIGLLGQIVIYKEPIYDCALFSPHHIILPKVKPLINTRIREYRGGEFTLPTQPTCTPTEKQVFAYPEFIEPDEHRFKEQIQKSIMRKSITSRWKYSRLKDANFVHEIWEEYITNARSKYEQEQKEAFSAFKKECARRETQNKHDSDTKMAKWHKQVEEIKQRQEQAKSQLEKKLQTLTDAVVSAAREWREKECLL